MRGSVLVFMPGAAEIRRTLAAVEPLARKHGLDTLPLHGDLSPEAQQAAVLGGGRPRIVVSTNVAEASITVEGVEAVIDSGLARVARYDPRRGLNRLVTERISRSSADQRAGRAGRQGPGCCVRLYSESDYGSMAEADEPEVRRVDLSEALLQILAWGTRDLESFGWLTPPEPIAIERAEDLLRNLGAVEEQPPRLNATGRQMLRLPVHPRPARILVEAERRGCYPEAALLAALSAERDIRARGRSFGPIPGPRGPETQAPSDLLVLAESWEVAHRLRYDPGALASIGLDARAAHRCGLVAAQLRRLGAHRRPPAPLPWSAQLETDLLCCIAAGYPDRVVRRRAPGSREGLMVGGMGTRLDPGSAVQGEEFFVALDAIPARNAEGRHVLVRMASGVTLECLAGLFPAMFRVLEEVRFDETTERVVGRRVTLLQDLPLEERETGTPDRDLAAQALFEAASRRPDRASVLTRDLEELLARLRWLKERRPDLELPAQSSEADPTPASGVDPLLLEALRPLCRDRRSFAELRKAPLLDSLVSLLSRETRRLLDAQAPARYILPSGRAARLLYRPGESPALSARIQELFGTDRVLRVGGGEVPVVLYLLAPNQRPVQVTGDLASFWRSVYPKIRLELRRRYPKHSWPEDPLAAKPDARPGRRGDSI